MTSSTGTLADLERVLAALRRSHDRLMAAAAPLAPDEVTADSYDDDWSIAQVLSHLGSGAEIFSLIVEAGLRGDPPGPDVFRPVWDRWNAMSPVEQVRTALSTDVAFVARLGALSEAERERWRLEMFGSERDLAGLARMRLSEHAVHTWDGGGRPPAVGVGRSRGGRAAGRLARRGGGPHRDGRGAADRDGHHGRPRARADLAVGPERRVAHRGQAGRGDPPPARFGSRPRRCCGWSTAGWTPTTRRPASAPTGSTSRTCGGVPRLLSGRRLTC